MCVIGLSLFLLISFQEPVHTKKEKKYLFLIFGGQWVTFYFIFCWLCVIIAFFF